MSENVLLAIIAASPTVLICVLTPVVGVLLRRISRDTAATRVQVENNHRDPETGEVINMREESDERHSENGTKLDRIDVRLDWIMRSVEWLTTKAHSNSDRIEDLEEHTGQTQTRRTRRVLASEPPPLITEADLPK